MPSVSPFQTHPVYRFWSHWRVAILVAAIGSVTYADCTLTSTGKVPLNDLGTNSYLGSQGGLYANGSNTRPVAHEAAGLLIAQNQILPRNAAGAVDLVNGKIVLISVGMSNTTQEFMTRGPMCFKPRADLDPSKNPQVVVVDCAQGGHAAKEWRDPANEVWTICDQRITDAGVTPEQVQVAWVKLAERSSDVPDKTFPAHSLFHQPRLGEVLRLLKTNYPHVEMAFMSSRTRSYENNPNSLNPEPFAYEENFSVKWLIEDQINGAGNLNYDPNAGAVIAPYIVWGPYLWADGEVFRSDGLQWFCGDLVSDFTHPSTSGAQKVADQLLAFYKTDPLSTPWFLRSNVVGQAPTVSIDANVTGGSTPLAVSFAAVASDPDGMIVEHHWTFGDGGFSLAANPSKTYLVPGTYTVYLTVTDNSGNPVTASKTITVAEAGGVPAVSTYGMIVMVLATVLAGVVLLRRSSVTP